MNFIDEEKLNKSEQPITKRENIIRNYHPWKAIFLICLPTIAIMVIMSTYNLVDKLLALQYAHQYVSEFFLKDWIVYSVYHQEIINGLSLNDAYERLAREIINVATQYSTSSIGLLQAFAFFVSIGTSVCFSIAYGKRDRNLISKTIASGIWIILILAIVISPILYFANEPLILLQSKHSKEVNVAVYNITVQLSQGFTKWFIIFFILMLLSNFYITLLRSEGQIIWATLIITGSVILNITLDIIFMKILNKGLEGAAVATVFSWILVIICVGLIIFFDKTSALRVKWYHFKFNCSIWFKIAALGMTPLFLNISFSLTSALSTFLVSQLSATLNEKNLVQGVPWIVQLFAGIAPWITLTDSPLVGISQGGRSLLSYAYGAKKYQRIWDLLKKIILLQIIILTLTEGLIAIFGNQMLSIFISHVDDSYRWYFLLSYIIYPSVVIPYIGIIFYQSIGKAKWALFFSSLRSVIVFIPMVLIGFFVAKLTKNPHYYFLFLGLIAPVSALITIPILIKTWKKYRHYLNKNIKEIKLKGKDESEI